MASISSPAAVAGTMLTRHRRAGLGPANCWWWYRWRVVFGVMDRHSIFFFLAGNHRRSSSLDCLMMQHLSSLIGRDEPPSKFSVAWVPVVHAGTHNARAVSWCMHQQQHAGIPLELLITSVEWPRSALAPSRPYLYVYQTSSLPACAVPVCSAYVARQQPDG